MRGRRRGDDAADAIANARDAKVCACFVSLLALVTRVCDMYTSAGSSSSGTHSATGCDGAHVCHRAARCIGD
jgi:hypothetical protein